jgi:hypothetical protein
LGGALGIATPVQPAFVPFVTSAFRSVLKLGSKAHSEFSMVVRLARLVVLDLDLLAEAENQDTHWWVWLDAKKRATEGHKGPVAVDETSL